MLSADGCVPFKTDDGYFCCPPPLCGNALCCTFVAFFSILPSGPLWDYWKQAAISYFESNDDPAECPLLKDPRCPSLVLHVIYAVLKLKHLINNAMWPALRESNPNTAVTTLDDWLARLRWEDCYNQHCRSVLLGEITPLEIWTDCGPVFCPAGYPPELEWAVKRGVVLALTRANMGIIKNICSINWVIEPLGAELKPVYQPPTLPPVECDPNDCSNTAFELCNMQDWLYGQPSGDVCETQIPWPKIPGYWDTVCMMDRPAGLPDKIWPGVLAAECIVRSMLPPRCPSNITRCC